MRHKEAHTIWKDAYQKAIDNIEQGKDNAMQEAGFVKCDFLQNAIDYIVDNAKRDNPYFPFSKPFEDLQKEDEDIDLLLMVEKYDISGSLSSYYHDLLRFRIGELLNRLGINIKDLFRCLFSLIDTVKNNTEKLIFIRNKIKDLLNNLDSYPGSGQVMQILILQGLIVWFENCNIDEGDNGYREGEILCTWINEMMTRACVFYFEFFEQSEITKYFDEYLATTEIGKVVYRLLYENERDQDISVKPEAKNMPPEHDEKFSDYLPPDKKVALMAKLHDILRGKKRKDVEIPNILFIFAPK